MGGDVTPETLETPPVEGVFYHPTATTIAFRKPLHNSILTVVMGEAEVAASVQTMVMAPMCEMYEVDKTLLGKAEGEFRKIEIPDEITAVFTQGSSLSLDRAKVGAQMIVEAVETWKQTPNLLPRVASMDEFLGFLPDILRDMIEKRAAEGKNE